MNFYDIAEKFEAMRDRSRRHSYIEIADYTVMRIECCKDIEVMSENLIRVKLAKCTLTVTGLGLSMRNYSREGVYVKGNFHSLEFEPDSERNKR